MSEDQSKVDQQIYQLADLTRKLGVIHDFQAVQLKVWPMAIFNSTHTKCEYHHKTRTLFFTLSDDGNAIYSIEGCEQLEGYCQYLLGEDVKIAVRTKDKAIYGANRFRAYEEE